MNVGGTIKQPLDRCLGLGLAPFCIARRRAPPGATARSLGPRVARPTWGCLSPTCTGGPLPSRPSTPQPMSAPLQQPADPDHENCAYLECYPAFLWPYELTLQKTRPGTSQRRYPSGQNPNVRSIWEDTQIKILMQYYGPPNSVAQAGGARG